MSEKRGKDEQKKSLPVKSGAKEKRKDDVIGSFSVKTGRHWVSSCPVASFFFFKQKLRVHAKIQDKG